LQPLPGPTGCWPVLASPRNDRILRAAPRIDHVAGPRLATDLVLLAHGGQQDSLVEPTGRRAALLRMWPLARAAREGAPDATVALIRYRYRGWNGDAADAAADVGAVLDALPRDVARVVLIGHSMGGRAIMRCAGHRLVTSLLLLAPWLPDSELTVDIGRRKLVVAHGNRDQVTDPAATARYVRRLRQAGNAAAFFDVRDETHALLRRDGDWNELTRRAVRAAITGDPDAVLDAATSSNPEHGADELPRWTKPSARARALASVPLARLRLVLTR
jgi:pimeloyl-ACP methyl ester carboxylesterase